MRLAAGGRSAFRAHAARRISRGDALLLGRWNQIVAGLLRSGLVGARLPFGGRDQIIAFGRGHQIVAAFGALLIGDEILAFFVLRNEAVLPFFMDEVDRAFQANVTPLRALSADASQTQTGA